MCYGNIGDCVSITQTAKSALPWSDVSCSRSSFVASSLLFHLMWNELFNAGNFKLDFGHAPQTHPLFQPVLTILKMAWKRMRLVTMNGQSSPQVLTTWWKGNRTVGFQLLENWTYWQITTRFPASRHFDDSCHKLLKGEVKESATLPQQIALTADQFQVCAGVRVVLVIAWKYLACRNVFMPHFICTAWSSSQWNISAKTTPKRSTYEKGNH